AGGDPRPTRRCLAAAGHPVRRRAPDRIPLGSGDRPALRRLVVQPLGDRVARRRGRSGHAVRRAVVRLPGCGGLVAAVLPGWPARRLPALLAHASLDGARYVAAGGILAWRLG